MFTPEDTAVDEAAAFTKVGFACVMFRVVMSSDLAQIRFILNFVESPLIQHISVVPETFSWQQTKSLDIHAFLEEFLPY